MTAAHGERPAAASADAEAAGALFSREELATPLRCLPPVDAAFAYGSAVFPQPQGGGEGAGDEPAEARGASPPPPRWQEAAASASSSVDYILAVADPAAWHAANLAANPTHYSGPLARWAGPRALAWVADAVGAGAHFNPLVVRPPLSLWAQTRGRWAADALLRELAYACLQTIPATNMKQVVAPAGTEGAGGSSHHPIEPGSIGGGRRSIATIKAGVLLTFRSLFSLYELCFLISPQTQPPSLNGPATSSLARRRNHPPRAC